MGKKNVAENASKIDYCLYSCNEVDEPVINDAPHIGCGGLQLLNLTINVLNYYRGKYLVATKTEEYTGLHRQGYLVADDPASSELLQSKTDGHAEL